MPGHKNQIAMRSLPEAYRYGRASVWHDRSEAGSSTDERTSQNYDGNGARSDSPRASTQPPIRSPRCFPEDLLAASPRCGAFATPPDLVVEGFRTLAYRNAAAKCEHRAPSRYGQVPADREAHRV